MDDILSFLRKRRSVRSYLPTPVPREMIEKALQGAMAAPSAMNSQPWEFLVIDRPAALEKLGDLNSHRAPAAVVVCADERRMLPGFARDFWIEDTAAAMCNLLNTAAGIGLGCVWIGLYPNTDKVNLLRERMGIPEHIVPMGMALLGYAAETPEPRTQYDADKIHYNQF